MDKYHRKLRALREEKGLSQEAIAFEMGIQRSTYGKFERGESGLFSQNLYKFLEVTGFSINDVLEDDEKLVNGYFADGSLQDRIDELSDEVKALRQTVEGLVAEIGKLRTQLVNKND